MNKHTVLRLAFYDATTLAQHYLTQMDALLDCLGDDPPPLRQRALLDIARLLTDHYQASLLDYHQQAERCLPKGSQP